MKITDLTKLHIGETATIVDLKGGCHFLRKAEGLGLRKGATIKLKSAQMMHGPITVQINHTTAALGYCMAKKILIRKNGTEI